MSATATRHAEPGEACAEAVGLARAAAEADAGPGLVGEHVGIDVAGDRLVTHLFDCLSPGYVGWRWAVTVARAARSKVVTVSESLLLPGPDSLLAPAWVPWTERVRPGDLKAGDLMPARSDDERLVPVVALAGEAGLLDWEESQPWSLPGELPGARELAGEPEPGEVEAGEAEAGEAEPGEAEAGEPRAREPGAGEAEPQPGEPEAGPGEPAAGGAPQARPGVRGRKTRRPAVPRAAAEGAVRPRRVLSATGRDEAAARWYGGENGPRSPLASAAPANCLTCGFMIRLSGPLGRVFGVCANEFAPDDGKVVSVDHGCGAHSDGDILAGTGESATPTIDELGYDMLNTGATVPDSVLETLDHEFL